MQLPPFLSFILATPFRPFVVSLSDGRHFNVTHPEAATVYHGGLGFWLLLSSGQMMFVEGDAVTSIHSAGVVNPSEFVRDD
jgi:hypothetical protein